MEKLLLAQRPLPRAGRAACPKGVSVLVGPSNLAGQGESPESLASKERLFLHLTVPQAEHPQLSQTVSMGFICDLKSKKEGNK